MIYYRPPVDITSGVYNLSLVVQDNERVGWGSGTARTFPDQYPSIYMNTDYYYNLYNSRSYLYTAALSGASYTLCLFPQVSKVFPSVGSVAGGTDMTIVGSGFSTNSSNNIVYVGGQRCEVIAADLNTIKCRTVAVDEESIESFKSNLGYPWKHKSPRSYGSPGFLVNIKQIFHNNIGIFNIADPKPFGLHQALSFSLYYDIGMNWSSHLGYYTYGDYNTQLTTADYTTILVAPYSGLYTFYIMSAIGSATLYGSNYTATDKGVESILVSTTSNYLPNVQLSNVVKSAGVHLTIGQRYYLRTTVVLFSLTGNDYIHLAVEVKPQFFNGTEYLLDGLGFGSYGLPEEINPVPEKFSPQFMHHHSLKDIQILLLSMDYLFEVQVMLFKSSQSIY